MSFKKVVIDSRTLYSPTGRDLLSAANREYRIPEGLFSDPERIFSKKGTKSFLESFGNEGLMAIGFDRNQVAYSFGNLSIKFVRSETGIKKIEVWLDANIISYEVNLDECYFYTETLSSNEVDLFSFLGRPDVEDGLKIEFKYEDDDEVATFGNGNVKFTFCNRGVDSTYDIGPCDITNHKVAVDMVRKSLIAQIFGF
jgi:hypothetical protein